MYFDMGMDFFQGLYGVYILHLEFEHSNEMIEGKYSALGHSLSFIFDAHSVELYLHFL